MSLLGAQPLFWFSHEAVHFRYFAIEMAVPTVCVYSLPDGHMLSFLKLRECLKYTRQYLVLEDFNVKDDR